MELDINYDLDKLEKRTASIIYQDGILDMNLGLVLIVFGIASLLYNILPDPWDSLFGFFLYLAIAIPLFLIQGYITKPRLGVVKYTTERKKKNMVVIAFGVVLLLSNVIVFILFIADVIQFSGNEYLMAAVFGLIPLILFLSLAYFLDFKRLYIVGTIFSVGFFIKEIFSLQGLVLIGNVIFISMGVIIMTIGLVCLIRFLKKYPKVKVPNNEFQGTHQ